VIWTQTYTGRAFTPLAPRPEDVSLEDIAHSLALQCRFNGHCAYHYSVAQHSIYVAQTVAYEFAPYALLHDSAEAYTGDLVRPIKGLFPGFKPMEDRVMAAICAAVGLPWPWPAEVVAAVKHADNAVLAAERDQIMAPPPHPWVELPEPPGWLEITEWTPRYAEGEFLGYAYALLRQRVSA
jgi:hypothetical protein